MMALRLSLKFENDYYTTAVVLGDMPKFPVCYLEMAMIPVNSQIRLNSFVVGNFASCERI